MTERDRREVTKEEIDRIWPNLDPTEKLLINCLGWNKLDRRYVLDRSYVDKLLARTEPPALPTFDELRAGYEEYSVANPRPFSDSLGVPQQFLIPGCLADPEFWSWESNLNEESHLKLVDEIIEWEMERIGASEEVREEMRRVATDERQAVSQRLRQT